MLLGETSILLPWAPHRLRPSPQANFPGQTQATASLSHKLSLPALVSTTVFSSSAESPFSGTMLKQQSKALLYFFPLSRSYMEGQLSQDEEKVNKKQNNYSKED